MVLMVFVAARVMLVMYEFNLIYSVTLNRLVLQFLPQTSARSFGVFVEPANAFKKPCLDFGDEEFEDGHLTQCEC